MKQRNHFYVERKGVLTWLMALGMVCSAVARLVVPGVKGSGDALYTWSQIVLPIAAALLYAAIVMLRGHEQLYKTAIPVWMTILGGLFAIVVAKGFFGGIGANSTQSPTEPEDNNAPSTYYILNTNSKKFHYPTCHSAAKISDKNRKDFHGTREELIQSGYSPCGNCDP